MGAMNVTVMEAELSSDMLKITAREMFRVQPVFSDLQDMQNIF